ncbi:GNAT family N-acetyltransferase [Psychrosphaera ytuae]|uniref:GNAT family N-acetyltransferase n=1 Tax=Psychrosphaera ytuae TaxID=2820710 RepID=A0A975HKJ8_9GAMM|nr:GNAT family N-acetyltransferase [Psychrosphaera ytuae]QTH64394.1 GNAT family N-acetyltransferase [Psychrosphaera ytuae]
MFWISPHNQEHQREINKFYKQHKQNVSANNADRVFVARMENSNNLIGVLILRNYENESNHPIWLLRSVYITPRMRRLGIASEIIKEATSSLKTNVYTICDAELIRLYEGVGFLVTTEIPYALTNLLNKKSLTLMVKLPFDSEQVEVF